MNRLLLTPANAMALFMACTIAFTTFPTWSPAKRAGDEARGVEVAPEPNVSEIEACSQATLTLGGGGPTWSECAIPAAY